MRLIGVDSSGAMEAPVPIEREGWRAVLRLLAARIAGLRGSRPQVEEAVAARRASDSTACVVADDAGPSPLVEKPMLSGPTVNPVDTLTLPADPAFESMGQTVQGVAPKGFSLLAHFRLDGFAQGWGHVFAANNIFHISISNATRRVRVSVNDGSGAWTALQVPLNLVASLWYRLRIRWDGNLAGNPNNRGLVAAVVPWNYVSGEWNDPGAGCAGIDLPAVSEVAVGSTSLGADLVPGWALDGELDHVILSNFGSSKYFRKD